MKKKKIKNQILRLMTLVNAFVCLVSVMSIETSAAEWKPVLCFLVSFGWIVAFCYANRYRLAGVKE